MDFDRKSTMKIIFIIGTLVLFNWILMNFEMVIGWGRYLTGILSPIILGVSFAFIINIPMRAIENGLFGRSKSAFVQRIKRGVSLLIALLSFVVLMILVTFIVLPELVDALSTVGAGIPDFMTRSMTFINEMLQQLPEGQIQESVMQAQQYLIENWQTLINQAFTFVEGAVAIVAGSAITIISSTFNGIFNFVVALVLAIYILAQKEVLAIQFKRIFYSVMKEHRADRLVYILRLSNSAFNNFFTGQCLEAIIIGVLFAVAMTIFGFPYALVSGVIIGVTALIPIFGAFIGCFISVFFIIVTSPGQVIPFIIMFLVIQQLEGNLIYPKVVGGSIGLPGIWVLVAVSVGGSLMGVLGMLTMVPITAIIYTLLKEYSNVRLKEKGIAIEKLK